MIQNKIDQLENSKKDLNEQIEVNNKDKSRLSDENSKVIIDEKNKQINNKISQIDLEIKNNNEKLDKLKSDTIAQIKGSIDKINQNLNKLDSNISSLEEGKKQIEQSIEKCSVKAPLDGNLNINSNLEQGVVLQTGAVVANIIPNSDTYKVVMIPNKDIANIKVSDDIKYSFESLPYREYGFLEGKIESLSSDSKIDAEKGISFFTGEGSLSSDSLYSNKGEESFIKAGMMCEAKIITRKDVILSFKKNRS